MQNQTLHHLPLFVAIESQPDSLRTEQVVLSATMAQQLLAHLATDLTAIDAGIQSCALTTSAALYDLAQLLRPGLPVFSTLSELLEASYAGQDFQARLLAFGAHQGRMVNLKLMPEDKLVAGPFQLIPLQLSGHAQTIAHLAEKLEHLLMDRGQLSAHTAQWLQEELGQKIVHARFMNMNDLLAMLYMQLESIGLEPLWEWLEKMLEQADFSASIQLVNGPEIEYSYLKNHQIENQQAEVLVHFRTYDQWVKQQDGLVGHNESCKQYLQFINLCRQASLLLGAHGLTTISRGIASSISQQAENLYCEVSQSGTADNCLVYHHDPELGFIAASIAVDGGQFNYYPLNPAGLQELKTLIQRRFCTRRLMTQEPNAMKKRSPNTSGSIKTHSDISDHFTVCVCPSPSCTGMSSRWSILRLWLSLRKLATNP